MTLSRIKNPILEIKIQKIEIMKILIVMKMMKMMMTQVIIPMVKRKVKINN